LRLEIHDFCLEQGAIIARSDGQLPAYSLDNLDSLVENMKQGSHFADFGSMRAFARASFRSHYLKPKSHRGYLPGLPNAGQVCERFTALAKLFWSQGIYDRGAMYLGAAAHLVQDLANPFHTTTRNLREHTEWERSMEDYQRFAFYQGGVYNFRGLDHHYSDDSAFGWVDYNAHKSAKQLRKVINQLDAGCADEALEKMLRDAQRTTAGFISFFFNTVGGTHAVPLVSALEPDSMDLELAEELAVKV